MPNSLTGDFEAVLQISNATLDRLVASMHQNGFADTSKPSVPHLAYFRIGGHAAQDVERGSVAAQVGAPHVVLVHGASDRFFLEFGFRGRYRADPGSKPLADVIHGTVRAQYRFQDIDPECWGWSGIAGDYLWMRVVEDSVSFNGTVYDESDLLVVSSPLDEEKVKARVVAHLRDVLKNQFEPVPQPIGARFRRMRSLSFGDGPGQAAVAIPFGLSSEFPAGNVASINSLFLDGRDFGLAVSREYIMAAVEPKLAPLIGLQRDFHVHGDAGIGGGLEIDYHVRIDAATAEWLGPLTLPFVPPGMGLIRIHLNGSGWASRLYRSGVYNVGSVSAADLRMSFSVDQWLALTFEAATERLVVWPFGAPAVTVGYGGPFAGEVNPLARDVISAQVQANLAGAIGQAQMELNALTAPARKSALIDQLRRIDGAANARFDEAVFRIEGLILRGAIPLSYRHAPQVSFRRTDAGDGFDAIESWIPGGRVDRFEWSWRWFTNPVEAPHGPPGSAKAEDDFLLRRPQKTMSKFGLVTIAGEPLPGLDGNGKVCLTIRGVRVDHITGARVPVTSEIECAQFGYQLKMPYEVGPYLRICDPLRSSIDRPAPEIGILRLGVRELPEAASNTLVLYFDRRWDERAVATLRDGLGECRRVGAGLLVVLLFRDGVLESSGTAFRSRIDELRASLPAHLLVNEDVGGGWAAVLSFSDAGGETEWRLVTPSGVVCWAQRGPVGAGTLASVLEERLVTGPPPSLARVRTEIADVQVHTFLPIELFGRPCPPAPLTRPGGSKLVFVQNDRASSHARLEQLRREHSEREDDALIAVVVEGADIRAAEALRKELELPFLLVPDPRGELTRRAGIRLSPTTLVLDERGRLGRIEVGLEAGDCE
jgi:hypothetical protein